MAQPVDPMHLRPVEDSDVFHNTLLESTPFRVLLAAACLVAVAAVLVTFWVLDYQRPYDFHGDGSFIIPAEASGNDQMLVKWRVTLHRRCPGLVRRELFDPVTGVVLATYDPQPASPAQLDEGFLNKTFMLPRMMQPGWVGYRSHLEYWCNPLQYWYPIRYDTPVLYFKVVK